MARSLLSRELAPLSAYLRELPFDLLYLCGVNSRDDFEKTHTVSIHLRRGDLAILWKKDYIGTDIEPLFENDVLLRVDNLWNLIPETSLLLKKVGDWAFLSYEQYEELKALSCCHAILRRKLAKPLNYYIEKVDSFVESINTSESSGSARFLILVFSDGFDQVARFLSKYSDYQSFIAIKSRIEAVELRPLQALDNFHLFVGEPNPFASLSSLLSYAMNADLVLADDSGFPMALINLLSDSATTHLN
jgi:hypothetical protein